MKKEPGQHQKLNNSTSPKPSSPTDNKEESYFRPPKHLQFFYPDLSISEYYTFQPREKRKRCSTCHLFKPSPILLYCNDCQETNFEKTMTLCDSCGSNLDSINFPLTKQRTTCFNCLGRKTCNTCHNEHDLKAFPEVTWDVKSTSCCYCLPFVKCPGCFFWWQARKSTKLRGFCICPQK